MIRGGTEPKKLIEPSPRRNEGRYSSTEPKNNLIKGNVDKKKTY